MAKTDYFFPRSPGLGKIELVRVSKDGQKDVVQLTPKAALRLARDLMNMAVDFENQD